MISGTGFVAERFELFGGDVFRFAAAASEQHPDQSDDAAEDRAHLPFRRYSSVADRAAESAIARAVRASRPAPRLISPHMTSTTIAQHRCGAAGLWARAANEVGGHVTGGHKYEHCSTPKMRHCVSGSIMSSLVH